MGFWREGKCDEENDDLRVERRREARRIRECSGPIGRAELVYGRPETRGGASNRNSGRRGPG